MSTLTRWLGGSPLGVLLKLLFLSLVVGIVLAALGLTPMGLLRHFVDSVRMMFGVGIETLQDVGTYILTGAAIVVPLFILARVFGARR